MPPETRSPNAPPIRWALHKGAQAGGEAPEPYAADPADDDLVDDPLMRKRPDDPAMPNSSAVRPGSGVSN